MKSVQLPIIFIVPFTYFVRMSLMLISCLDITFIINQCLKLSNFKNNTNPRIKTNKIQQDNSLINSETDKINKIASQLVRTSSMNKSDRRLKTIQSQQLQKYSHQHHLVPPKKYRKEISQRISVRYSGLQGNKSMGESQVLPKKKKSHQNIAQGDKISKVMKELQSSNRMQQYTKKSLKYPHEAKINKSLVFSQHKLTNPQQSSNLKASKLISTDQKSSLASNKQKQPTKISKKISFKGSTTKKHSKSVYNYTQFNDNYNEMKRAHNKQPQTNNNNKQRSQHNRSSFTQHPHHISTSSITKRMSKSKSILKKILNNSQIKKKTSHFKILSNCLRTYIKQEQHQHNKIDPTQIIKLVQAFNVAEVSKMSRPLSNLISQMIHLIRQTVQIQRKQQQIVGLQIQAKKQFQTPQRINHQKIMNNSSSAKPNKFNNQSSAGESIQNPNDICKTKKFTTEHYQLANDGQDSIISQQNHHNSSPQKDMIKMQKGLVKLKSESKQLNNRINQSFNKNNYRQQSGDKLSSQQKQQQIDKLRLILERQNRILQQIQYYSGNERDMQSSSKSSLKYYPSFEE